MFAMIFFFNAIMLHSGASAREVRQQSTIGKEN